MLAFAMTMHAELGHFPGLLLVLDDEEVVAGIAKLCVVKTMRPDVSERSSCCACTITVSAVSLTST